MRWNVTTRALRTVTKYGSLDKYVLGVRTKWLGDRAMWLRCRLRDEINKKEGSAATQESGVDRRVMQTTEIERARARLLSGMPVRRSYRFRLLIIDLCTEGGQG